MLRFRFGTTYGARRVAPRGGVSSLYFLNSHFHRHLRFGESNRGTLRYRNPSKEGVLPIWREPTSEPARVSRESRPG